MIYVWVRTAVDWSDEEAFLSQLHPAFAPKVRLWDATFDMPYREFRLRLEAIARENRSRVAGAVPAGLDEIPDGAIVLPIDDDDWLAPDAAHALEAAREDAVLGYIWRASFVEVPMHAGHRLYLARRRLMPFTPEKWVCSTNNCAFVKTADSQPRLTSHMRASGWVKQACPQETKRVTGRLSAVNRNLASQTTLLADRELKPARLLRKYRRYGTLYDAPPAAGLAWCAPELAQMRRLMDDLGLRGEP